MKKSVSLWSSLNASSASHIVYCILGYGVYCCWKVKAGKGRIRGEIYKSRLFIKNMDLLIFNRNRECWSFLSRHVQLNRQWKCYPTLTLYIFDLLHSLCQSWRMVYLFIYTLWSKGYYAFKKISVQYFAEPMSL